VVGRVASLPPAEAGWNDPPWSAVRVWNLRRSEPLPRLPAYRSEVKLLHDGKSAGVLVRCEEPEPVVSRVSQHDGPIDQDDSVQVYLTATGSTYAQIATNPDGYVLDAAGMAGGQRISRPRADWQSGARVTTRKEPGAWYVRLDIPLEEAARVLGEADAPNQWRILVLRSRVARPGEIRQVSMLPVTHTDTPYCPLRYRRLTLATAGQDVGPTEKPEARTAFASIEHRVFSATERKERNLPGMVERHLRDRARVILEEERRQWTSVKSREAWEQFRDQRMLALKNSLRAFPEPSPLQARISKTYRGEGYLRDDLLYQSRPGLWVTANLYRPDPIRPGTAGIVIVHSHHRPRTQAELQDMGILWARSGAAVLIMDQIGAGERLQNYPWNREAYHSRYVLNNQLYLAGESLIQWMVWDILRGVDLLLEQPGIDRSKIILLGAVAGGGDPAAVAAALDNRIAAVAPFNFGECTPETPRFLPEKNRWPLELADPGWGSWESTRNLRGSIAGQFLPWLICASVAPRRFVYSFEMGWNVEDLPAWARYRRVFGFYGALDRLDEAHGFGPFPGPGECTNVGPAQRKTLYPELQRWFGIPIPEREPEDRRPESELASLTPEAAAQVSMRPVHEIVRELARRRLEESRARIAKLDPSSRRRWLGEQWAIRLGAIQPEAGVRANLHRIADAALASIQALSLETDRGIIVPLLLFRPKETGSQRIPVVTAVSQAGKERFLSDRAGEIETLLRRGIAICLPDLRGTGETVPDTRRTPSSAGISLAATELMLANTMLGPRLKDLRAVLAWLRTRPELDSTRLALWGDSFSPTNPPRLLLDEFPNWQIGPEVQHQAEPLGALVSLLTGLYDDIDAIAVRGGLESFLSVLDSPFSYVPQDVIVPGFLEVGDVEDLVKALPAGSVLQVDAVDGRNRLVRPAAAGVSITEWISNRVSKEPRR
jgi:dienelactone hydrolase